MTAWTDLVKEVFRKNKTRKGYRFKNALMDAKKIYRSGKKVVNASEPKVVRDVVHLARKTRHYKRRSAKTHRKRRPAKTHRKRRHAAHPKSDAV
jgi:hypothetical protein